MGVVYKAEDTRLHRSVALKFVSDELVAGSRGVEPVRARSADGVGAEPPEHLHDPRHRRAGRPRSFIVMEYLEGTTLKDRHRRAVR